MFNPNNYKGVAFTGDERTTTPTLHNLDDAQAETEKLLPETGMPGRHRAPFPTVARNAKGK